MNKGIFRLMSALFKKGIRYTVSFQYYDDFNFTSEFGEVLPPKIHVVITDVDKSRALNKVFSIIQGGDSYGLEIGWRVAGGHTNVKGYLSVNEAMAYILQEKPLPAVSD